MAVIYTLCKYEFWIWDHFQDMIENFVFVWLETNQYSCKMFVNYLHLFFCHNFTKWPELFGKIHENVHCSEVQHKNGVQDHF